jgi:predicted DNA-binding protein
MNKEQEKEYKRLERHAKDCGVAFGIYSKEYSEAIHEMNDYWLDVNDLNKTFAERVKIKVNRYYTKLLK